MATAPLTQLQTLPEVLAPAGGRAQFFAALNSGANAVYLGLQAFNARARAENFTIEDLKELLPVARQFNMKVLVTVNVLIKQAELSEVIKLLAALEELEVYAIIVQDLAVARLVKRHFPHLRLHASTQMAVHNLAGVLQAVAFGFKRVVLARELTAVEIRRIRAKVPREDVELEVFCHGSLCYAYSGLCFFSGASDGRSGNRGECAYTCRQPYKIVSEPGHGFLFSMRDLDTSNDLASLVDAGVDCLKIEGRKKDAQYVSTVVALYRRKLAELVGITPAAPEASDDLAFTFHRRPTSLFLKGRYVENVIDLDNPTHLGVRAGEIAEVDTKLGQIRFKTLTPLERFDGLRVQPKTATLDTIQHQYANDYEQFSLRNMYVNGSWQPTAAVDQVVDVDLGSGEMVPSVGDVVYKVRSVALKQRVEKLSKLPANAKLRSLLPVALDVQVLADSGELVVKILKFAEEIASVRVATQQAGDDSEGHLREDIEGIFAVFGNSGFYTPHMDIAGTTGLFVSRQSLKAAKKNLEQQMLQNYPALVAARLAAATAVVPRAAAPSAGARRFTVKTDRLAYLEHMARFAATHPDFQLEEIIFEPKRAFLNEADGVIAQLAAFAEISGIPVRLALPTVVRAWDEPLLKLWLRAAAQHGWRRFEIGNVGALKILEEAGLTGGGADIASDFSLYTLNAEAAAFWLEQGISRVALSVEDDLDNLRATLTRWPDWQKLRPQAILYKDTPLFIAEACSLTALHNGCPTAKVCGYRDLEIENAKGERFVVGHENCKSIVYGKQAYAITEYQDKLLELGVTEFRLDFLTRPYTAETIDNVLSAALNKRGVAATHPANFNARLL